MGVVDLHGQQWHYQTWGNPSRHALLLLHGFTGSYASWEPLATRWADQYFVVAPDLPGHGQTQAPQNPHELSLSATADRLVALCEHLFIPKVAVLGYSMGGRHALALTVRHPQRVTRLVLESTSPGLSDETQRHLRQESDQALANTLESRGIEWFVPHWANLPLFQTQSEIVREAENRIRRSQTAFGLAQSLRGAGTGEQVPLWEHLNSLPVPVLIITGSLDAKFCAVANQMVTELNDAVWVSVDEAGHTVHAEQPMRFLNLVSDFLSNLE